MGELQVVELVPEKPGASWSIRQIKLENGSCPVEEWLDTLEMDDAAAIFARLQKFLEADPFPRLETLKTMTHKGNMYEVVSGDFRILGFRDGMTLVLTTGWRKKTKKTPPGPMDDCEAVRERFVEQRRAQKKAAERRNGRR